MLVADTQLSPSTDRAEAHLGRGYDALKQERFQAAVSEFRAALEADPALVMRARFPLAVALFELHNSTEARREFEAVRRGTGDHPNVLYYLGRLDLAEQNFGSAVQNLTKAVAEPPFPDTAYYLGVACFKHGDLQTAEKWLKLAAQINPRDGLIPFQLAQVYRKERREDEANRMLELSRELRQHDADESKQKLDCTQALDQRPRAEARALCQKLYDPNDAEKLSALGTLYGQHGDLEAAVEPLQRAAELAPQSPQMQYNLAYTYYRLNLFEQARKPIAAAVQRWPDIFQLNMLYAAILSKLGQYSDSLRYFDQAAKLRPDDPQPLRAMAEVLTLTGHPKEAAAAQQKAEQLSANAGRLQ